MAAKVFLNRQQTANRLTELGLKTQATTLAKYAVVGGGPPFQKWGRMPVYDPDLVDRWAQERLGTPRSSTSESPQAA
jgi:hypothetical protein